MKKDIVAGLGEIGNPILKLLSINRLYAINKPVSLSEKL